MFPQFNQSYSDKKLKAGILISTLLYGESVEWQSWGVLRETGQCQ